MLSLFSSRFGGNFVSILNRSVGCKILDVCLRQSYCSIADVGLRYDVSIVGAGPAGLSAAIRLKQLSQEKNQDVSVCILEKGAEVGSHILSGNVLEPRALDELLPNWKEDETCPVRTPVKSHEFAFLTKHWKFWMPNPPQMNNRGNYVVSLSQFCKWLGQKAEDMGVDILPGFPATSLITQQIDGPAVGVCTKEADSGEETKIYSKYTLLSEGCRGSITEDVIKRFRLRELSAAKPQTYGLGLKEIWEIQPTQHQEGHVLHTIGYPLLQTGTYGGGFVYHMSNNMLSIGLVLGLDYSNPHLETFQEFQRFKNHPSIRSILHGGRRLEYGARTLNEGGSQNIPYLEFPGGALLGCGAGFMNVAKIKGTHTAMKTGMLAAETLFPVLTAHSGNEGSFINLDGAYDKAVRDSWILKELKQVRNIRPGFQWGLLPGLANAALEAYIFRGFTPWTLSQTKRDNEKLQESSKSKYVEYPPADGEITFDLPSSLYTSGTNHDENQPCHLKLQDQDVPLTCNLAVFEGPESKYCPAGVYEFVGDSKSKQKKLQIQFQNCLHCKACDIKDPLQNIKWTVPKGGDGPKYTYM